MTADASGDGESLGAGQAWQQLHRRSGIALRLDLCSQALYSLPLSFGFICVTKTLPHVYCKFMTSLSCQSYPHRVMEKRSTSREATLSESLLPRSCGDDVEERPAGRAASLTTASEWLISAFAEAQLQSTRKRSLMPQLSAL